MSEPTDFKNVEYRTMLVPKTQICSALPGWEIEKIHDKPLAPVLLVTFCRRRTTPYVFVP